MCGVGDLTGRWGVDLRRGAPRVAPRCVVFGVVAPSAAAPGGRRDVLALIAELRKTATVIFSTHVLTDIERICDRVAILRDGRMTRIDRVDALRDMAHHQVELRFAGPAPRAAFEGLHAASDVVSAERVRRMSARAPSTPVLTAAAAHCPLA